MSFTFDPESHTYTLDGSVLPSVTQIIRAAGFMPNLPFYNEWARDRGSIVHTTLEWYDQDALDESTVEDRIVGYLEAYKRFREAKVVYHNQIEQPMYHDIYRYAGTPDRVCHIDARPAVLDIKTGKPEPWHGIQTAAYAAMLPPGHARFGLYLSDAGTFSLVEHKNRCDGRRWLAALELYSYLSEIGAFKKEEVADV